jgi:hypothetical protein
LYQNAIIKANKSPNVIPNKRNSDNIIKNERPISAKAPMVKKKSEPVPAMTPIKSEKKFVRPKSNYGQVLKTVALAVPVKSPVPAR